MAKKCRPCKVLEMGRVTTDFVGNFKLIKNQVRMQGQKLFVILKTQKVVTIIIKERLLSRKSFRKYPFRVVLFFRWRELPIQDD